MGVLPQTKHLVDGLSRFFTPTSKRSSRVSLSAIQPPIRGLSSSDDDDDDDDDDPMDVVTKNKKSVNLKTPVKSPVKVSAVKQQVSQSQQAASRILKRSRKLKSIGSSETGPPLSGQLRGLFDGLSKFFNATGDRKRTFPVYNPVKRRAAPPRLSHSHSDKSLSFSTKTSAPSEEVLASPVTCDTSVHSLSECSSLSEAELDSDSGDSLLSSPSPLTVRKVMEPPKDPLMRMSLHDFRMVGKMRHRGRRIFARDGLARQQIYRGKPSSLPLMYNCFV